MVFPYPLGPVRIFTEKFCERGASTVSSTLHSSHDSLKLISYE